MCGQRRRKGDALNDIRRLLLVGEEQLSAYARRRIESALSHPGGDRYHEVHCGWVAKENFSARSTRQRISESEPLADGWKPSMPGPTNSARSRPAVPYAAHLGKKRLITITGPALPTDQPKLST